MRRTSLQWCIEHGCGKAWNIIVMTFLCSYQLWSYQYYWHIAFLPQVGKITMRCLFQQQPKIQTGIELVIARFRVRALSRWATLSYTCEINFYMTFCPLLENFSSRWSCCWNSRHHSFHSSIWRRRGGGGGGRWWRPSLPQCQPTA